MTTLQEAVEKLAGKHPLEIAAIIQQAGITGKVNNASKCPLAKYVWQVVDGIDEVTVSAIWITGYASVDSKLTPSLAERVDTPSNVHSFVQLFDTGIFPDLIEGME